MQGIRFSFKRGFLGALCTQLPGIDIDFDRCYLARTRGNYMSRINVGRVIIGGIVAGVVLFFLLGALHMKLLAADWEAWKATMVAVSHAPSQQTSMKLWFAMSLVTGLAGVWIYAGIRPRFGPGVKTGLLAGFLLWLGADVPAFLENLAMGILPMRIIQYCLVGELVAVLVSVLIGAAIYKE
jgi:hypothetical protein